MSDLRIYKYPFNVQDEIRIEMPKDASILTIQAQDEVPCIWAIVDIEQPTIEVRRFRLFGTGHPMDIEPALSRYIGTFQLLGGRFIGHLFDIS